MFKLSHVSRALRIEWTIGNALRTRRCCEHRFGMHRGSSLAPIGGDVLHARTEILGICFGKADTLVFLGIRQTRVDGKRIGRIMAHRIEWVGLACTPCILQREQQATTRNGPQRFIEDDATRFHQLTILQKAITNDMQR